ncbi:hypothetical protein N7G274_010030 [Stereocaulon virgatum]|uniref:Uncharacterized protein n=1 Tax=Stereocaulon virgatum TaxID=373712 RepID=A0ABR3ZUB3_9LECA
MELNASILYKRRQRISCRRSRPTTAFIYRGGFMGLSEVRTTVDNLTRHQSAGPIPAFQFLTSTLHTSSTTSVNLCVVNLPTSGHRDNGVKFGNYHFEKGGFTPPAAHRNSKTTNIYMTKEMGRCFGVEGFNAYLFLYNDLKRRLEQGWGDEE